MLFIDYDNIPPFENKAILTLLKMEDFDDINMAAINPFDFVLDIRGCNKSVFNKVKTILGNYPTMTVFVSEPVPRTLLSRTDAVMISDFTLSKKAGIIELLLKLDKKEGNFFNSKIRKIYNLGE